MARPTSILMCLMVVSMLSDLRAEDAPRGRRLAVIVGNNEYRPNQGLDRLGMAINDAHNLSAALRNAGFTVIEMTHDVAKQPGLTILAPNADYIRDQIEAMLDSPNLGVDDTVLISLHGHGVQYDFEEQDAKEQIKKTAKFYFCPADAALVDRNGEKLTRANDVTERNHLLALDELYAKLEGCTAATRLLIVDACRNDPSRPSSARASLASLTLPKLPPPPGGVAAFFSCKANQRAMEDPDLGQGVFTHFLIQGLKGKADQPLEGGPPDGIVTFSELTSYVANNTYSHVQKKYPGTRQSPDMRGDFDTNLPLVNLRIDRADPRLLLRHLIDEYTEGLVKQLVPDPSKVSDAQLNTAKLVCDIRRLTILTVLLDSNRGDFRSFIERTLAIAEIDSESAGWIAIVLQNMDCIVPDSDRENYQVALSRMSKKANDTAVPASTPASRANDLVKLQIAAINQFYTEVHATDEVRKLLLDFLSTAVVDGLGKDLVRAVPDTNKFVAEEILNMMRFHMTRGEAESFLRLENLVARIVEHDPEVQKSMKPRIQGLAALLPGGRIAPLLKEFEVIEGQAGFDRIQVSGGVFAFFLCNSCKAEPDTLAKLKRLQADTKSKGVTFVLTANKEISGKDGLQGFKKSVPSGMLLAVVKETPAVTPVSPLIVIVNELGVIQMATIGTPTDADVQRMTTKLLGTSSK